MAFLGLPRASPGNVFVPVLPLACPVHGSSGAAAGVIRKRLVAVLPLAPQVCGTSRGLQPRWGDVPLVTYVPWGTSVEDVGEWWGISTGWALRPILPPLCTTYSDLGFCRAEGLDNDVWTGVGGGMWSTVGRGGVRWLSKLGWLGGGR